MVQTEINGDGVPLTISDLVFLLRIITGDAIPFPKAGPSVLNVSTNSGISIDGAIGAAHFVFNGNAEVTLADGANDMELMTNYRDGQTHAILYSFEKGKTASGHILNTNGELIAIEAASYDGASYKTRIAPPEFSVKSYPNPFNPTATIEMNLPIATDWNITIFNVIGQRVADFNGHNDPGLVKVQWNASNEPSGIYFYKVDAGRYLVTKRMVLLK